MKHSIDTYFELNEETKQLLEQANLARYSVKQADGLVLETLSGRSFIKKGISQWKFSLSEPSLLIPQDIKTDHSERVIVEAIWYASKEADQKKIVRNAGKNANIFEGMGVILVPEDFKIPCIEANKENVKFYGLELIENGKNFPLASFAANMMLMEYDYKPDYRDEFLTQENGGGGYYVETHNFPHIHIPLFSDSAGYIIIGKKLSTVQYSFTAFKIPYGYALYTPPGTIHGDGTLLGRYGISVANSETTADTVLFFNKNTLTKIDGIIE